MPITTPPTFQAPGGGTVTTGLFGGGTLLTYASPAGVSNNVNPGGAWPSGTIGRLNVDTTAGNATWTGLVAEPKDGYGVLITNIGANVLTLDSLNAGSSAGNQFQYVGNLALPQYDNCLIVYYLAAGVWVIL
jgi:hypothetical protein